MGAIAVNCPNCSAALQAQADQSTLRCAYCGSSVLLDNDSEVRAPTSTHDDGSALDLARAELQCRNYAKAYDYYLRASEEDPDCVEGWLGLAATVTYSSRSQNEQARILAAGATSGRFLSRLLEQERFRVSQEVLTGFECACRLLRDGAGTIDRETLATYTLRLAVVARGADLFRPVDSSSLGSVAIACAYKEANAQLRRFTQCLYRCWCIQPSPPLTQELSACCEMYAPLQNGSNRPDWLLAITQSVAEWRDREAAENSITNGSQTTQKDQSTGGTKR